MCQDDQGEFKHFLSRGNIRISRLSIYQTPNLNTNHKQGSKTTPRALSQQRRGHHPLHTPPPPQPPFLLACQMRSPRRTPRLVSMLDSTYLRMDGGETRLFEHKEGTLQVD